MERANWSSIPGKFLYLVAEKIDLVQDYVNFSVVCRHWYFIASDFHRRSNKLNYKIPYCIVRIRRESDSKEDSYSHFACEFNSKFTFRTYDPKVKEKEIVLDLPELSRSKCWGSRFGWMVTFCPIDFQFSLLEPFSRETLPLPSLRTLIKIDGAKYNPYKAFLMADPDISLHNCFVLLVVHVDKEDSILAFAKPGDNAWSSIDGPSDLNDIIVFEGNYYGVSRNRHYTPVLVLIEIDQPHPRAVEIPMDRDNEYSKFSGSNMTGKLNVNYITKKYLVDLDGELCLVIRYVRTDHITFHFRIFKIHLSTHEWTRVISLGDRCLFVGNNYTFAGKSNSRLSLQGKFKNPPDNFSSDCVFYTQDDDYTFHPHSYMHPNNIFSRLERGGSIRLSRADEGIYPITPIDLYAIRKSTTTTYPQLWVMRSLRFRRLEQIDAPQEDAMIVDSE